ncbi:glycosyltransferase [Pseudoalteromonas sp. T1lg23B]|uniref:glycosyltransferase n=1 Tax=Pseudoalteromonas sp. T1lg23B TaxID=2077097 RepID=UPI000CF679BF|nr:glycosyltransferase [Pseudoalteromonas sp. T1lg23B]
MSLSPLVTIYMPTHNRLGNLQRAIRSIESQSYGNWELIIVNDGSSDGTNEYLESLNNNKIRVFHNVPAQGACHARNVAIENAKGYFITGLDDDDEFTPDRLQIFIDSWNDTYSFLCSPVTVVRGTNHKVHPYFIGELDLQDILVINKVGNQIFCKTEDLRAIGGFDTSFKAWQDYDTWVRFTQRFGKGIKLDKSTYLQHEDDKTGSITRSPNRLIGFQQFLDKHQHLMSSKQKLAMNCWEKIIQGQWVPLLKLALADKNIVKYGLLHNLKLAMGR